MALPPLLRHIYNYGTEEVIRRGKRIFHTSGVSLLDIDHLLEQIRFRVRNDLYHNYYTVTVNQYLHPEKLSVRCQCPYNLGEICRHEAASLFQLHDMVVGGYFNETAVTYNQAHTVLRIRVVNEHTLRIYAGNQIMEEAVKKAARREAAIRFAENDRIEAEIPDGDHTFLVVLHRNEERYFDTSCGCDEQQYPLCVHKATLFLQILQQNGPQYFQAMHNWNDQKNKLLSQYGYSMQDDLTDKFTFTYENGKPFLRVLDPSIKKVNFIEPATTAPPVIEVETEKRLGVVIDTTVPWYPFVQAVLVSGESENGRERFSGKITRLELRQYLNPGSYAASDRSLLPVIRKFIPEEILKYLRKNLPFGEFLDDYQQVLKEEPTEDIRQLVWEYLLPRYIKLLDQYAGHSLTFLHDHGKPFSSKGLQPLKIHPTPVSARLYTGRRGKNYRVSLEWYFDGNHVPWQEVRMLNAGLFLYQNTLHVVADTSLAGLSEIFMPQGYIETDEEAWPAFLEDKVMAWRHMIPVHFADEMVVRASDVRPEYRVYLKEREMMLTMQPAFSYNGTEVTPDSRGDVIVPGANGSIEVIQRNEAAEDQLKQLLHNIHRDIRYNEQGNFFHLQANRVLAENWFFQFLDTMKEHNVSLFGFEDLRHLRINQHKPNTRVQVSSGIDWFDAAVEISFGDQVVTIAEVKKALARKENFVQLSDGTLGLLPEEWLKKYALLVKMGTSGDGKLRLRKFHFSILDALLEDVDETALLEELEEKKERLTDIINNDYSTIQPPDKLQAELRPYQISGFQWLLFLQEAGWGGILADDMGLGKTVQTLSFLLHYKEQNPDARFLVVCPTTLMYNWENEIRKFTPNMSHVIHHGPKRQSGNDLFASYDITITTYGTMRSDIKLFRQFEFDYIILDESQAIKNPQSQVAKAALLLHGKNRLALSGTPLQNNTFDLYAQMNFLNPGLLGSREFFMNQFATPIDKFQEPEVKQELRKLIYPFLLRRTKEQVAKDLPEKTESLLYCEMGTEQRRIYDAYRNSYKNHLLGMIDDQGMERSRMHVLQGLTKLRQICDSPAILNEAETFENHSVKTDQLMSELTEHVGNHKALIFSQFLGMLAIIRARLEENNIPYAYFDGSTSTSERERAIRTFQEQDECRVFLISLKAGGIGLNLTAADYVYIVDPWWNPAVEQQAIDRTHRIGQTRNIFAYRLICKDTIEEKMLILQERKRTLAQELISDDNAFIKRLTRDDIAYLLS